MPVVRIDSLDRIRALADQALDPTRVEPIICVSTRHGESQPLVDADALAARVGTLTVHVLPTGELTWELSAKLPPGLEVYGGAIRIWWPGLAPTDDPRDHPLVFCWAPYEASAASERVLRELAQHGWDVVGGDDAGVVRPARSALVAKPTARGPAVVDEFAGFTAGQQLDARVVQVFANGVEVEVPGGIRTTIRNPRRALARPYEVGGIVAVRVVAANQVRRTLELSWAATPDSEAAPALPAVPTPTDLARLYGSAASATPLPDSQDAPQPDVMDLEAFRAEALSIVDVLHDQLALTRSRIEAFASEQLEDVAEMLSAALNAAHAEARVLRLQLEAAETDKRNAIAEMRKHRERAHDLEKQAKREHNKRLSVEARLHGHGVHDDAASQLRHEVAIAVARVGAAIGTTASSAHDYVLGQDFLASLDDLQGISRPEVADKIARLLLDAPNSHGHPLRTAEAGSAPQRVRASDNARAYRLNLQQGTPSARRLHYWQRNDGVIELANVGVHDAVGIR